MSKYTPWPWSKKAIAAILRNASKHDGIWNEWCIENNFAAQRELAAIEEARWFSGIEKLRSQLAASEAMVNALEEALRFIVDECDWEPGCGDSRIGWAGRKALEATCQK